MLKIDLKHVIILHTRQAVFTGVVKDDVKEPTFTFDGDDMQETTVDYVRAARILKCLLLRCSNIYAQCMNNQNPY